MDIGIAIVKLFSEEITRETTILQISKAIKKSYASTNQKVWELIEKGVLTKKEIGKSVICSINLKSPLARAMFAYSSMLEGLGVKVDPAALKALKDHDALTAFLSKSRLIAVCEKRIPGLTTITKAEFKASDKAGQTVIYGHEKYWELTGEKDG
jgi:hypothetical protein